MRSLSELFDTTSLVVPCSSSRKQTGEILLAGNNLSVAPLTPLLGKGVWRKIMLPLWMAKNSRLLIKELWKADAVHAAIPGDVGTIGLLLAVILRKPLFVRHCGNWFVQQTTAERFWKLLMERLAGGKKVMLATGGALEPPSKRNQAIGWIFATTLTEQELRNCLTKRDHSPGEPVRLIIVCRQERAKGTGVVIRSLPLIMKDFPRLTLDVVGDGCALDEFRLTASELGVLDRIAFHGKVDHHTVLQLLRQAHIFCYPTRASEGFPKVVLEALACGLPVITTRVSVLPQLLGNGSGILIEETTPAAVADAVLGLLARPDHYRAMSRRAVETARQYSLERWRDTIGELLHRAWGAIRTDA
jgi:glycosyltransferase involved in cell wall biosynthesis